MQTPSQLLEKFEQALNEVSYPKCPVGLYEPISYVLSCGGKRLRPVLLLLAYNLYKEDVEKAIPAALALETYHNHTLLHDDLMDHADMRRGRPTVHKKWDENTAVLSGDTMLIMAFQHMLACDSPRMTELLTLFARSMQEICEGQQYDVNFEQRNDVTEEEYIEMIRLKTSVLLACAIKTGALVADAPAADADALYAFGEKIGLAFQLQDDYLDVYGDPAVFGKKIGGDILCGKKTYMLINAYNRADVVTGARLLKLINDKEMDAAEKIAAVTDIYNQLNIAEICQEAINRCYDEAHTYLDRLSVSEEKKQVLWDFAASLLGRKN